MIVTADTLDDLLLKVFKKILQKGVRVNASKGANTELAGILLELKNPRARLSRTETKGTLFSCLGESLWYLAKSNRLDYIEYYLSNYSKYSDDKRTVHGAYPPPPPVEYDTYVAPPYVVAPGPYYVPGPYWRGYGPRYAYGYGHWRGYRRW